MPAVVTFDGPNKIITEISAPGDNELFVTEIYSEWKDFVRTSDNAKFLPAFSVVGGDPITPTQNLGSTFFLENGWRLRPAESNHKLTVVGNLFTREPGESVFVPTLGNFTVNTETRVSNLVDSSIAQVDVINIVGYVTIDTQNGVPGTTGDVGTPGNPVNNVADAFTIAQTFGVRQFVLYEDFVLDRDLEDWTITGQQGSNAHDFDANGFTLDNVTLNNVTWIGSNRKSSSPADASEIQMVNCTIDMTGGGIAGTFDNCGIANFFSEEFADDPYLFTNCYSIGTGPAVFRGALGGIQQASARIRDWHGELVITNIDNANATVFVNISGQVTLDASVTAGSYVLSGHGLVVNNSTGTSVVDDVAFVTQGDISLIRAMVANDVTVSLDDRTVTVFEPDGVTVKAVFDISADGRIRTRTA